MVIESRASRKIMLETNHLCVANEYDLTKKVKYGKRKAVLCEPLLKSPWFETPNLGACVGSMEGGGGQTHSIVFKNQDVCIYTNTCTST